MGPSLLGFFHLAHFQGSALLSRGPGPHAFRAECWYGHTAIDPCATEGRLGCFPLLTITSTVAVNSHAPALPLTSSQSFQVRA